MTTRLISSLCIFAIAVACFCILAARMPFSELSVGSEATTWFPLVNIHYNAYHMWRLDHLSGLISRAFTTWSAHTYIPVSMAILCLGTYRIARIMSLSHSTLSRHHFLLSWLMSIIATFAVVAAIGSDSVSLSALSWIPILAVAISTLVSVSSAGLAFAAGPVWLVTLFISIEASISANQLAPLTALVSWFIATIALRSDDQKPLSALMLALIVAVTFGPAVYASSVAPSAPFPHYPHTGHLVPDDGLEGIVRPLVGFDYPLQVVDRGAVKALFSGPSILITMLACVVALLVRRRGARTSWLFAAAACAVAICTLLDTMLPEAFALISPVSSISRLIPWGTSISLTPFALGLATWLLCLGSMALLRSSLSVIPCSLVLIGALVTLQATWLKPPLGIQEVALVSKDESLRQIALSPSLHVILSFYRGTPGLPLTLESLRSLAAQSMHSIEHTAATLETNPIGNGRTLERLVDGNSRTRWTSNLNRQEGIERLVLRFATPTRVRGIELDPGDYNTDFPRGVVVTGGSCDEYAAQRLADFPSWQGSLDFTPSGHPFFRGQSDVKILFTQEHTVECLFVYQTATAPFNWTIAEIRTTAE